MVTFPDDVSVAIVNFNGRQRLPYTLEALQTAGCPLGQVTVIDNASHDGSREWLEACWPQVKVVALEENNGPNPARNAGLITARTPYVLLMDDDIMVDAATIPMLRAYMAQDSKVAITSPVILYADRPNIILYSGTELHFMCEAVNLTQGRVVDDCEQDPHEIGVAPGGALLVKREAAIKVGLFDERYFIGKADGDFSQVIRIAGYKILGIPQARVIHNGEARGSKRYFYQIRNRWYFMLKNYQLRTLLLLLPVFLFHEALQFGMLAAKGHALTYLKAFFGLLRMLPAIPAERRRIAGLRVRPDWELLVSGPVLVSDNLLTNALFRRGKAAYDRLLDAYWSFLLEHILKPGNRHLGTPATTRPGM